VGQELFLSVCGGGGGNGVHHHNRRRQTFQSYLQTSLNRCWLVLNMIFILRRKGWMLTWVSFDYAWTCLLSPPPFFPPLYVCNTCGRLSP
jgi:hypothetical protein